MSNDLFNKACAYAEDAPSGSDLQRLLRELVGRLLLERTQTEKPRYVFGPDPTSKPLADFRQDAGYWSADEYAKCLRDLQENGCAFMRNGMRIDPRDVRLQP